VNPHARAEAKYDAWICGIQQPSGVLKMAGALPKIDRAFLSVLARGAEKTFDNAEKLYFEAELLAKAGATARALCLHQISLEECSKVETMGAWATSLLSGLEVDQNKILAASRRHSSKNKSNAYMLEGSPAEKDAKARGDWETVREEFRSSSWNSTRRQTMRRMHPSMWTGRMGNLSPRLSRLHRKCSRKSSTEIRRFSDLPITA
jgi:AbiV family abortive infection protein